jgi:HPt (histidine-containing phosphotransfer) domain-containing protein
MTEQINLATYEELKAAMGDDFIGELVETYLTETPALIKQLHLALNTGDAAGFQRLAHSIKSSSASFGALEFAAQAKELELIGKSGDLKQVGDRLTRLEETYQSVSKSLQALIAAL